MPRTKQAGVVNVTCNPEGRPGYKEMIRAWCQNCHSEPGDCEIHHCPFYSVSSKNKHKDKMGSSDFSWLVRDDYQRNRREQVNMVNRKTGQPVILNTYFRKDVYPDQYDD